MPKRDALGRFVADLDERRRVPKMIPERTPQTRLVCYVCRTGHDVDPAQPVSWICPSCGSDHHLTVVQT